MGGTQFLAASALASAAISGVNTVAQASAQQSQQKLQNAQQSLEMAVKERDTQRELQKSLAQRNNNYAARGINASNGSALLTALSDKKAAGRMQSLYSAERSFNRASSKVKRRAGYFDLASGLGKSLLDFSKKYNKHGDAFWEIFEDKEDKENKG